MAIKAIGELGQTTTFTLPLALDRNRTAHVHIRADLVASVARGSFGSLAGSVPDSEKSWVFLRQTSQLAYEMMPPAASGSAFLQYPAGTRGVHGLWDTPVHSSASISLYSTLQHENRYRPTRVVLSEDVTADAPPPLREVFVTASTVPLVDLIDGKLYVPATPKALAAVRALAGEPVTSAGAEDETQRQARPPVAGGRHRLLLTQSNSPLSDVPADAVAIHHAHFTVADLGGWPADPSLHLIQALSPAPANASAGVLTISLNGLPLAAADLRMLRRQQTFAIPAFALRADNKLEVDLRPAQPQQGSAAAQGMSSGTMYLSWTAYQPWHGTWPETVDRMQGSGQIFFPDGSPGMALAAARLLGGLSRLAPQALVPELGGDPALTPPGWYRILVGSDPTAPPGAALALSRGIEIFDPSDNSTLLRAGPYEPIGAAQYVSDPQPTVILQRGPTGDSSELDAAVASLIDPSRFFELDGNVVVGIQGTTATLELGPGSLQQRAPTVWGWRDALSRLRWVLLAPLAALVVAGAVLLYLRMGQPAPLPSEPGG